MTLYRRKFVSNVFGLSSIAFRMGATHFSWRHENLFFPQNDVTVTSLWLLIYLKRFVAVVRIRRWLHWLSSSIRSGVMANHNFTGHCSGRRGRL